MNTEAQYTGYAPYSQQNITCLFKLNTCNTIRIITPDNVIIPLSYKYIIPTDYPVTALKHPDSKYSILLVEHLLATCCLMNLYNLDIYIQLDDSNINNYIIEIPIEDGSGKAFYNCLQTLQSSLDSSNNSNITSLNIKKIFHYTSSSQQQKYIILPNSELLITYLYTDPVSKQNIWINWSPSDANNQLLINSRTWGHIQHNKQFNFHEHVMNYDDKQWHCEFRHNNEPAYHKILDMIGDLSLAGLNPVNITGHIISYHGSHKLNAVMAQDLAETYRINT